jgi:hypothetical protein
MRNGVRTEAAPSLDASRRYAQDAIATLPPHTRALSKAESAYPVEVSQALANRSSETENALKAAHNLA